jgi:hypothetical protein
VAKRATASALLQAGRRKPPAVSPPERPVIPPGPPAVDVSAGPGDDWFTSELVAPAASEPNDQSTEQPVSGATSQPNDLTTSPPEDKSPSELDASLTEETEPVVPLGEHQATSELDDSVTELLGDPTTDEAASAAAKGTSRLGGKSTSELVTSWDPAPGVGPPATSALANESPSAPVILSTSGLTAQSTSPQVGRSPSGPVVESTSPLEDQSTSTPVDSLTGGLASDQPTGDRRRGGEVSQLNDEIGPLPDVAGEPIPEGVLQSQGDTASPMVPAASPRPQMAAPSGRAKRRDVTQTVPTSVAAPVTAVGAATSSLVSEATGRYERLTVFLTPAQRQWLKRTGRQMPVEGLSVSDIVRLAVNRLSADVNAGLPLVDELTSQAYGEAETMAGRRNRGLPPI